MKIYRVLCLCVCIALPGLALAKLPPSAALGQKEGMLDYCAQIDPQSAAKYEAVKQRLAQGVPVQEVADARNSTEYREAYDAFREALGNAPKDQALNACRSLLESKQ
jgi:hypothetical protein